jgi:enoyl-CoA hydratase/carnithine racemase
MSKELGKGTVLCDVDARGVVTVTLNRPKVNNAYNEEMDVIFRRVRTLSGSLALA